MLKMIRFIVLSLFCLPCHLFAQPTLVLTDSRTGKTVEVNEGDKVLLAFRTPQREVDNQPADVFVLQPKDFQDSTFVHLKTRIRAITDSTIILKNGREMRLSKLAGIRKLSVGKQIARTAGVAVGYLGFIGGVVLVSEHFDTTSEPILPFLPSLGIGVAGAGLMQFVTDQVPAHHLQRWRVSVRKP